MSSYAEALQTTINTATQKLQQEQQQLSTTLKAQEKQNPVTWNSLLASTLLAEKNIQQSISLSAENAANVQIMATAVMRLASDCGSINNIIIAANPDSDISTQAKNTDNLSQKAAYSAELASQLAMESSALAARLTYSTMLEKLKAKPGKDTIAELKTDFADAQNRAEQAATKTNVLTEQVNTMSFQLVDAVVAVQSLEARLLKKKATNPLISSDLIQLANGAYTDAGNAFALLLVAVKSTYAASSAAMQSATIAVWINDQLHQLN